MAKRVKVYKGLRYIFIPAGIFSGYGIHHP